MTLAAGLGHWHPLAVSALIGVVVMNIAASACLKFNAGPSFEGYRLFGIFGWPMVAGMTCYGVALVLYAWSLKHIDLHVAQIVVSLQFVGTIIVAALIFKESITAQQWGGISLIFLGLFIALR